MDKISYIFLLFIIYSMFGWLIEVTLKLIIERKFVNRGFFIGPYCPIYGFGMLLIIYSLKYFLEKPLVIFFLSIIICSLVEYLTSFVLEKLFNTSWWDYSDKKFNLNGRICLETTIPFGIGCLFVLYIVNPFINKILMKIPSNIQIIIAAVLFVIVLTDVIISLIIIIKFSKISENSKADSTEKVTKYVKNVIIKKGKVLYVRFINAFPDLKILRRKQK